MSALQGNYAQELTPEDFEPGQEVTFLGYSDNVVGVHFPVGATLTVVEVYDEESDCYEGLLVEDVSGRRDLVWVWEVTK